MAIGLAPAAHAQLSWQGTAVISAGGVAAERPDVEMSSGGEAIAVWERLLSPVRIDATLRPAGGNFPAGTAIDDGSLSNDVPDAGMGPAGHAQAVWEGSTSNVSSAILGKFRGPGGGFGARQFVSSTAGVGDSNFTPETTVDAQGNALAVWEHRGGGGGSGFIVSRFRSVGDGMWSTTPQFISQDTGLGVGTPRLAMRGQGEAVTVWSHLRANPPSTGLFPIEEVYASFRSPGPTGAWTSQQRLCETVASSNSCRNPQVAMGGDGTAVAVWTRYVSTSSGYVGTINAAVRSPGAGGTWGAVQALSSSGAANPHVAMDAGGNAVVVWERAGLIEGRYRPAGQAFRAAVQLSAGTGASAPRVAMSSQGKGVVAWVQINGNNDDVNVAESTGDGNFGAPFNLASHTEAFRPDVATDAQGGAIVTWEGHDGQVVRIHSRIGVPPGVAPPPPPPPPPPEPPPPPPVPGVPTVTAFAPAEGIRRDSALVLTAQVAGPVDRIVWNLPGGQSITGRVVNGQLQRSIRFRPDPGNFSVRAQAFDGGRAGPSLLRNFTMPRPRALAAASSASEVARVRATLSRLPSVSATGDAAALLGRSNSCDVPTSIKSGSLDLTGCFTPTETLADIPSAERGVLDPLARELRVPVSDADLMRKAVELSDGYVTRSPVSLEGDWPLVPRGGASILAFPQASALSSSNAGLKVGGYQFGQPGGFVLDIDPRRQGVSLPALPRPPSLRDLGGFPLVGDFDVKLVGSEAHISSTLKLPSFLKKAGVDVQAGVRLRATPDRLIIDDMTIGPINVDVGALAVKEFRIAYRREGADELWHGQGKACVISGICLDMVPPNGQVKIRNGRLDFAGASLGFRPGIPLFAGVDLERIGFGFGLDPTRFTGNARMSFSQILVIDGRVVLAFPSPQQPFILRRDEVGNDFPAHLYNYRYTGPTFGVSAAAALRVPVVGEVPLAQAYVLYEYPSYLALGGGMKYGFTEPLTGVVVIGIEGRVDGEFNAGNGRFNVDGRVEGCVVEIICRGFEGNVSSRGMAVCANVSALVHDFHAGGAIRWSPFKFIPYLDGCVWGRFREPNVRGLRKAQAGGPYQVQVAPGAPSRMLMVEGRDGAPRVRVTGPGGQVLESPEGPGLVGSPDAKIRILRSPKARFAAVALAGARPGTYSIETMDGSVPIARIQESTALPAARASGRVGGAGTRRFLDYAVAPRPDQVVTFHDVGPDGAGRQIGTLRGGGRGRLAFSPAPGQVRRTIKARFEIDGVPAEERVLASFAPPSPVLARPARLRVRRLGTRLAVGWARVGGAARYEVAVTFSNGRQRFAATRNRSVVLRGISRGLAGRVTVRAVAPLRQGTPSLTRFRATARRRTAMRALPRCRRSRARIVCTRR
ncbi:MAG TPA: hypothetical protein VNB64_02210 [Solirubrobacteraceae bacterium]|nr:hypothetical protein [Solirubrobacteraceae bacterium]